MIDDRRLLIEKRPSIRPSSIINHQSKMAAGGVFERIAVVLVETVQPGNIGSAARAMSTMGLSRLKLVNPRGVLSSECLKMAGKAVDLVTSAGVFTSLEAALEDENVVIGTTSSRDRETKQRLYSPREIAPLVHEYAQSQRVAIVFGSEKRGLRDEHLARCQYLITIPAHPDYPVLNLAQAVMVVAYEIYNCLGIDLNPHLELATQRSREEMFEHLEKTLLRIGFLSSSNPGNIMDAIRRFLGRADLTPRDIQILRGILSQVEWFAQEGHKLDAGSIRKP
ncbi:MAG: RNA methyltransferase [Acidobacteria bacterium]|nr:MAG: RNA methyltransferase [Acidobacteriota bacterium]